MLNACSCCCTPTSELANLRLLRMIMVCSIHSRRSEASDSYFSIIFSVSMALSSTCNKQHNVTWITRAAFFSHLNPTSDIKESAEGPDLWRDRSLLSATGAGIPEERGLCVFSTEFLRSHSNRGAELKLTTDSRSVCQLERWGNVTKGRRVTAHFLNEGLLWAPEETEGPEGEEQLMRKEKQQWC